MASDPYELLGVSRTATTEEIRKRYRYLAQSGHVDLKGDPATWARITSAYGMLTNDEARAKHLRREAEEAVMTIFSSSGSPLRPAPPQARHDDRGPEPLPVRVPFLVALRGGRVDSAGVFVRVPRGSETGCAVWVIGGPAERLYRLEVEPHPAITREGLALDVAVQVNWLEAYRGGPLRLPTPWGPATVLLAPATVRTGDRLVVAGYGVRCRHQPASGPPRDCGCPLGELRATVTVSFPPSDRRLIHALEQLLGDDDPRAALTAALERHP